MKNLLTSALLCLALTACGPNEPAPAGAPAASAHDHSSLAGHGGSIVELGDHAALLEIVHDEAAGVVTAYVMDVSGTAIEADGEPVLNVPTEGEPVQLTGVLTDGGWAFSDDSLKGHVHNARLRISVGGKVFNPVLPDNH